jgi:hypothetical protein
VVLDRSDTIRGPGSEDNAQDSIRKVSGGGSRSALHVKTSSTKPNVMLWDERQRFVLYFDAAESTDSFSLSSTKCLTPLAETLLGPPLTFIVLL